MSFAKVFKGLLILITNPGLTLTLADVKTVMANKGNAPMGIGIGSGGAVEAAQSYYSTLETTIDGAGMSSSTLVVLTDFD